jgi:hypothetical protein
MFNLIIGVKGIVNILCLGVLRLNLFLLALLKFLSENLTPFQ